MVVQYIQSYIKAFYSLIVLLICIISQVDSHAQNFNFEVAKTDESCQGNAMLTFIVTNVNPQAIIEYTIYKYPDLDNAYAVTNNSSLGSLTAGTYKVIASEILPDASYTLVQEIAIDNINQDLSFEVTVSDQNCSQSGTLIVNIISGNAALYEIFSGPVTRLPQSSNTFEGLPPGTYSIRVFDDCGEGKVTTYTLVLNGNVISISDAQYPEQVVACDSLTVSNNLTASPGSAISYPLTIEYTIYPPGEPSYAIVHLLESGDVNTANSVHVFPVGQEAYTYDIKVTDNCGNIFEKDNVAVSPFPEVTSSLIPIPCAENYIQLQVSKFKAPFTISFLSAPGANFNPSVFNGFHPGPFTESVVRYGDQPGNPMPAGDYIIEITDACGRKATTAITIETVLPEPKVSGINNGCFSDFGSISAAIPYRIIVSAEITPNSPADAAAQNVNEFITDGKLQLNDLPVGFYTLTLTDECGRIYVVTVEIPEFTDKGVDVTSRPDCTLYFGSIEVKSGNGKITEIIIMQAPQGFAELFNQSLPFDISFNLSASGVLYMDGLPQGEYVFKTTDVCGIETITPAVLTGYSPANESYNYIRNCGSFDIALFDVEAELSAQTYWLQKFDLANNQWIHPATGAVYTEGSVPNSTNSISLVNNQTLHNLIYTGTFRIVKSFKSYGNGVKNKNCIDILGDFEFSDGLKLGNTYKIACQEMPNGIYLQANGVAPYNFEIVMRNDEPFFLDNGSNNIFTGLSTGTYKFIVTDACGSQVPLLVDLSTLPSLAVAYNATDLFRCTETLNDTGYTFDLTEQTGRILGNQSPDMYTVTYYLTAADADSGVNAINTNFVNTTNPQTIYTRVEHNSITLCHANSSFNITVNQLPEMNVQAQVYICDDSQVTLSAGGSYDSYLWSTGETSAFITVKEPGEYFVTVRNYYDQDNYCESQPQYITVAPSVTPAIISIDTEDWTDNRNSIIINTLGNGDYEYSLDNVTWQNTNVFDNLTTGVYMVYVKDKNGCGMVKEEVVLLNYPKFFTPNGDFSHDKWRIKYSANEPRMTIDIFDRYGKLIIVLDAMDEGWDGTLNGEKLPSTDYWFVAKREDGRIFKGHFAMKR